MNRLTKRFAAIILSMLPGIAGAAPKQVSVDYYGVVSKSSDLNMLKMAQDIFLSQMKTIDYIAVEDRRPSTSGASLSVPIIAGSGAKIAFYTEIEEGVSNSTKVWNCKFNAIDTELNITHTKTESFDSYYKILASARLCIESVLSDFKQQDDAEQDKIPSPPREPKIFEGNIDIESLAGTWFGEPYTDKIIVLRGGRGFIIYKNGATMNIKITAKGKGADGEQELEVVQVGKSNASFFPELPRQVALNIASSAHPIVWTFRITDGELHGTKKTLLPAKNENGASEGTTETVWKKR